MTEQLLWTFDDVKGFAKHPDTSVRRWAVERLIKTFPNQAGDVLIAMVDDPGKYVNYKVLDFLANTGDTEKYGPPLLDYLNRAEGELFGRIGKVLAKLDYKPALPKILDYLNSRPLEFSIEFASLIEALGLFGGNESRQLLWQLLEQESAPDNLNKQFENDSIFSQFFGGGSSINPLITPLMEALLQVAQPEDIPRLVQHYRTLPFEESRRSPLSSFASSLGISDLVDGIHQQVDDNDIEAVLEAAEWQVNVPLQLSDACIDALVNDAGRLYTNTYAIALQEARRLVTKRNDDIESWQTAWETGNKPTGYKQQTLYTLHILQAFADMPKTTLTQRTRESALALALLTSFSVNQDDEAALDVAADKTEALLSILASPREHVLPDIEQRVVAQGPEIAPKLISLFNKEQEWPAIRIANTITRLSYAYPGSCNGAISTLIDSIEDYSGDFLTESASEALVAIGPPVIPAVSKCLRKTKDLSQQIYLTGVLSDIPTEASAELILAKLNAGEEIDEGELTALSDIGSALAIEPLYSLGEPDGSVLAEALLTLCQLNGVEKPEIPEWRQLIENEEQRMEKLISPDNNNDDNDDDDETSLEDTLKKLSDPNAFKLRRWQLDPEKMPQKTKSKSTKSLKKKKPPQNKKGKGKKNKRRRK